MKTLPYPAKVANLSELKAALSNNEKSQEGVLHFLAAFNYERLCAPFERLKTKGFSFSRCFLSLCLLRFTGITVFSLYRSGMSEVTECQKDVFYRLRNNPLVNWRNLLLKFALMFNELAGKQKETENKVTCFVLDDTLFAKTGKAIEFIGKVYDHVKKRYVLGIRQLVLGYWDGKSFFGIDFSLHCEKGNNPKKPYGMRPKDLKNRFHKSRSDKSAGAKRVKELRKTKIDCGLKMIRRAVNKGITASYVLFDSWFFSEQLIKEVTELKNGAMHVLGMCPMGKRTFVYMKKEYGPKKLVKKLQKTKLTRCRKLRSNYVEVVAEYHGVKVKLFFSRYANCKDWKLIVTTDLKLNYIKAIEIYQIRWSIEVFFKETKQYLGMGKCQSNDFDAQIADTTLAMITYMILAMQKRINHYETIGGVFRDNKQEMLELTLWERLWGIIQEMLVELTELFGIDIEDVLKNMTRDDKTFEKYEAILKSLKDWNNLKKVA